MHRLGPSQGPNPRLPAQ